MKKGIALLTIISILFLSACGNNTGVKKPQNDSQSNMEDTQSDSQDKSIEVDKNLLDVSITLPASFFDDIKTSKDEILTKAKENGAQDIVENADGSITYKMTKSDHKKMMVTLKDSVLKSFEELNNENTFTSIKEIKLNDELTKATVIVDKSKFESSMDGIALMSFAIGPPMYQIFNGVAQDEVNIEISLEDDATKTVFKTLNYPADLNKKEKDTKGDK